MFEVKSIIRPERVAAVIDALHRIPEAPGITISVVRGIGKRPTAAQPPSPEFGETEMAKLETVVTESMLRPVVAAIQSAAATGRPGDGKVFVSRVEQVLSVHVPAGAGGI